LVRCCVETFRRLAFDLAEPTVACNSGLGIKLLDPWQSRPHPR